MAAKRKELLTHPRLQAKWIGLTLMLVGLSSVLVYVSIDRSIALSGNEIFLSGDWLRERIQPPFFFAIVVALVAAGFVALFQLHGLLGPVKNLENALRRVENGDLKEPFKMREADDLQDLAACFRSMQESVRGMVLKDREKAAALKAIVDRALADLPAGQNKLKEDLSFVSKELGTLTDTFKL